MSQNNPLLADWTAPFAVPPLAAIRPEHFPPAFEQALAAHRVEVDAVAGDRAEPDFDNTVAALERSGRLLARVSNVFYVLAGAHTSEPIQAIERDMAPKLARHWNEIHLNEALFGRIDSLHRRAADLGLTPEQARVLERYHALFRRAGAGLPAAAKERLKEIGDRLASLGTAFGQNVLADEQSYVLPLSEDDLAGLPDFARAAARGDAEERGLAGHAVTLSRSSVEPFLQFSGRRELREKAFRAWVARGDTGGTTDNNAIIAELTRLRDEKARLLGYASFADYKLDDTMAKTPAAVTGLLDAVWAPARRRVAEERDALQEIAAAEGGNFRLAPWDWRYYAEKLRKARFDLDESEIKPYLPLEAIIEAAFYTANRLFGLTFTPRADAPVYHPDVRVWEVTGPDGRHVGVFFGDYFARASKRSGAWMTSLRDQERLDGEVRPLVVNVMNFNKGAKGEPTLLSFDDARTLFHEFGHGLHGLMSDVTYPMISGTGVLQDFVELPSQLYEHWLDRPEILEKFARHYKTGEPMPQALMDRLIASRTFNQGFMTAEYLGSSYVDLDFHLGGAKDAHKVEAETRARMQMPEEVVLRHRPPHFGHIFSGDGYAAGYYSYLWSEVLDADAFNAFEETGDVFDAAVAKRLRDHIYAAGGARDPAEAYRAFRGRMPSVDPLLKKRGLLAAAA
ncbi:MAG: M3 family metallopeptidase [Alphaproteobacteria bacterium]